MYDFDKQIHGVFAQVLSRPAMADTPADAFEASSSETRTSDVATNYTGQTD